MKKRKFKMVYVLIAVAFAFAICVHLGRKLTNMNEGQWTITVETKMPGEETSFPMTHEQHLTKTDPVPAISLRGYECRLFRRRHRWHVVGNHVWWMVYCEGSGPDISGTAHIKYSGDTLKGKVQMHTMGEKQQRFETTISGYCMEDGK